jgi:membrane-associated phospholipid phosphatase
MPLTRLTRHLHCTDTLFVGFLLALAATSLLCGARIPHWGTLAAANLAGVALILAIAELRHRHPAPLLRLLHDWYILPGVFVVYRELGYIIRPLHGGRDYDGLLIAADRWLFSADPTVFLAGLAVPWLTELLQIAYSSFYFLFLILGFELYRRKSPQAFHLAAFTCVYGFLLSYLGYFLLPAVGPRYTLHDFAALNTDLPGLWATPFLRWFVNAGAAVPMGVPAADAIAGAQRDVFPSGHTMLTLVLIHLAHRYRARSRAILYPVGALLIGATVYLRYHYVVDLIAGAACFAFCIATAPTVHSLIRRATRARGPRCAEEPRKVLRG